MLIITLGGLHCKIICNMLLFSQPNCNESLRILPKTAFLCIRRFPAGVVLKCYDWTIAQREAGNCVIVGAHSKLEKDLYGFLLKGQQPLILALARGMRSTWSEEELIAIEAGRL